MQMRKLGRTGLDVSLLTFGCGAVGGLMTKGDPADQMKAVTRALALGVNFFDTAPLYGDGASERNIGRILREIGANVVLGTKVNVGPDEKVDVGAAIERSLEASLKRLGRERVDLLQLHNSISTAGKPRDLHPDVVLGEVAPAFERLKAAGKIGHGGITAIGDTDALHRVVTSGRFATAQIVYNLLNPSAGRSLPVGYPGQDYGKLLEVAAGAGMGTIVIRVIAGGALSGDVARHPLGMAVVAPIGSGADYAVDAANARRFQPIVPRAGARDTVDLAIRYVAGNAAVSTLQVGIATVEQFEAGAQSVLAGPLPAEAMAEIAAVQDSLRA